MAEPTRKSKFFGDNSDLAHAIQELTSVLKSLLASIELFKVLSSLATKSDLDSTTTKIMSAISDYAATVEQQFTEISNSVDSLTQSIDGVTKDINDLKAKIDQLQNNPGPISPEDQAILDSTQATATNLATRLKTVQDALAALDAATETPPTP